MPSDSVVRVVEEDDNGKGGLGTLMDQLQEQVGWICEHGRLPAVCFTCWSGSALSCLERASRTMMEPGFEENPNVAGGLVSEPTWRGDALVRLRFERDVSDLPLHVHEQSDRCIVALVGSGWFHYVDDDHDVLQSHAVATGTMLVFSRGLIHTFTANRDGLALLSYHSPFFDFRDPRQWAVGERARRLQGWLDDWVESKSSAYAQGSVSRALRQQAERENPVDLAIGPVACSQHGNA